MAAGAPAPRVIFALARGHFALTTNVVGHVRAAAFLLLASLLVWAFWPSSVQTEAAHANAPRVALTARTTTEPALALSVDNDGNVVSRPVDEAADLVRIEGIVIDEMKNPIGGAIVHLGLRTTLAEADGTFAFDDVVEGDILLRAERGEWYGEERTYVIASSDPIEVVVLRGSTVVLHVVTESGAPIANAKVEIGQRELYTGASGTIRARGLDPTGVRLTVSADGFGTKRVDVELDPEHPTAEKEMTVSLASGAPVSGIVVDDRGERVPEAWVSISAVAPDGWTDSVTANERGEFTIPAISPGKHTMSARSDRHVATPDMIVEHAEAPTTNVVVRVTAGAELAGRVVDSAGNPVAGASVRGAYGSDTGPDGRFLATGIDPGERTLSAYIGSRSSGEQKVTLTAGTRTEVTLVIHDSSIAGRVVDRHGTPVVDAQLWARATDDSNTFFASADEYGRFDFGGIPPGDYRVITQHPEEAQRRLPDDGPIVHTGRRDLAIVLPALASITGRVVLEGAPVPYFGLLVTKTPDTLYFENVATIHDPTGRFAQSDIAPGTWSVVILGPGFANLRIDNVIAREGQPTDLGTVVVERGRIVRGRVTDSAGRPVRDALVVAGTSVATIASSRIDQRMQGDTSARTDASGRYELVGLPTEDLQIVARTTTATSVERTLDAGETSADFELLP